jgi:hypothetical protein
MLNKLMPREGRFFDLFNAHAAQIVMGSEALGHLIANATAGEDYARRIDTICFRGAMGHRGQHRHRLDINDSVLGIHRCDRVVAGAVLF